MPVVRRTAQAADALLDQIDNKCLLLAGQPRLGVCDRCREKQDRQEKQATAPALGYRPVRE